VLRVFLFLFFAGVCAAEEPAPSSTVFFAQNEAAISGYDENGPLVRRMVEALVVAATGKTNATDAWRSLAQPSDRVGIKISASGGVLFSTHKAIVRTIADGLSRVGVRNIIVWDRADMAAAGFRTNDYIVREVEPVTGYDPKAIFSSPMMGKLIWGDAMFVQREKKIANRIEPDQISDESHWSRVLGEVTKIINVPVLSTEEHCGVAGCLYNATIPNVDNWRRFVQAPDTICDLYRDPRIQPKVVLNIVDGLIAQFAGGPGFQPNYAWAHATIYASKDPVALDATILREIDIWRAQSQLPSIAKRSSYLETAEQMRIGNSARERIELKNVEVR